MEYFWKENKRFVVAVGGGLLLLLVYNWLVLSKIRAGAADAANARSREKRDLERKMSQGVPNDDGLVAGRRDRDQNRKLLAAMIPEVGFTLGERFQKKKLSSLVNDFDNLKLDLTKALGEK